MTSLSKRKFNICLISDQLSDGGAERCAANLSIFFEENHYSVTHVVIVDRITYDYKGEVFNLGKLTNSNVFFRKIKKAYTLKKFFDKNKFDFIIDFRFKNSFLQELITTKFIYNTKTIFTIHSYVLEWYFPKSVFFAKLIFNKTKLVAVSEGIGNAIQLKYGFKNVTKIYNPIHFESINKLKEEPISIDYDYIVAVGRLEKIKQFDVLITAYHQSKLHESNVKLIILGEGQEKSNLEQLINSLQLSQDILLMGFIENPYPYIKNSKYLVMTSRNEGFPMVLIESLACQTPVISYDMHSGPSEIIKHRSNGILVKNQDIEMLVSSMKEMYSDSALYNKCKENSLQSVSEFSLERIGNQWIRFLSK